MTNLYRRDIIAGSTAMIYSKSCEYAIRALACLAASPGSHPVQGRVIARAEGISAPVLRKVLHLLTRKRLLRARRGPGGGFCLARRPALVSLMDVVAAVDGLEHLRQCAVGLARCSDDAPCPLHHTWKGMREQILQYLETTSLSEMARALARKKQLLGRKGRHGIKQTEAY